ncbi:MAG: NAD(P)/FAD-dependent oxidoreductase [Candidatus Limnocylindrales bacterium]|nr:NAD(P)/FAD-dependent oxidoreductase [Candidatus Limnocylindrales bacterium]
MTATERVEVVVVGGGPAGAALAAHLARAGREVVVLERAPRWRWRAGGVFASPAAVAALGRTGLDEATVRAVARPIPAMRVETPRGATFRLTYGADEGGEPAVGFDRSRLDPALLELAGEAGADVRPGVAVVEASLDVGELTTRGPDGTLARLRASVIVGADGLRSVVARAAAVARPARLAPRVALTFHLEDPEPVAPRDARMCVLRDGYVGIAPVPGGRVNVGIVLGGTWRPALAANGAEAVARSIVEAIPPTADDPAAWRFGRRCDSIAGAWPLGHRVTRRAGATGQRGQGWLLIGDAAGFLDPFTGEGLHRALASAELAARAISVDGSRRHEALAAYDRAMQRRFLAKDAVSWLVQAFLARPQLFEYAARRVASRASVRATMGLVMGDLVPAGRALDPRYLAALLAP